jgi:hypothetical protein
MILELDPIGEPCNELEDQKFQLHPVPVEAAPDEPILCPHCRRTANNGIKCKGICVAESDY